MIKLNYKTYGEGEPLIILHGLFGMLDNWSTIARRLGEFFQVFTIDLRNHGKSPHHPAMDYSIMAADIADFVESHQLKTIHVVGHSMGGKVAMQFAINYPHHLNKLLVVDIAPNAYKGNHAAIFKAFKSLDLPTINSRKQADEALKNILPDFSVRQFILKNLARNKDGQYFWRPAVDFIHNNYTNILSAIEGSYDGHTLFIKGEQSNYIQSDADLSIQKQFHFAQLEVIKDAGHWIHAEQPVAFFETVKPFLLE